MLDRWRKKRAFEAETKALEAELGEIREAAIVFAKTEGVQVIAGTGAKLRVTGKERVLSPAKGTDERNVFEKELRALGVWDDVAMLDPYALEKAVAEGKWGDPIRDRIRAYLKTEIRYTVTLKEDKENGTGEDPS